MPPAKSKRTAHQRPMRADRPGASNHEVGPAKLIFHWLVALLVLSHWRSYRLLVYAEFFTAVINRDARYQRNALPDRRHFGVHPLVCGLSFEPPPPEGNNAGQPQRDRKPCNCWKLLRDDGRGWARSLERCAAPQPCHVVCSLDVKRCLRWAKQSLALRSRAVGIQGFVTPSGG